VVGIARNWRRAQSGANLSPTKFPANREKYREFSHFAPQEIRITGPISLRALGLSGSCRCKSIELNRQFSGDIREFDSLIREQNRDGFFAS
jgi:hypothetical protein